MFSPDALRARKIVNLSCWGVSLQDHVFATELSVGEGLMHSGSTETMITSIRAMPIGRSDLLSLYYLINHGLPFGMVASMANKLRLQRGERADFFCFGDPEGSIERPRETTPCEWREGSLGSVVRTAATRTSDLAMAVPQREAGDKVIIVESQPDNVACGLLVADHAFISVADAAVPGKIGFRLLSTGSPELNVLGSVRQLLDTMEYLEHLTKFIRAGPDWPGLEAATAVLAGLEHVRDRLADWPFWSVRAGDVIRANDVSVAFSDLSTQLNAIGSEFAQMYLSLVSRGTNYLLAVPDELGASPVNHGDSDTCANCGEAVEEVMIVDFRGQPSRLRGYCCCCGPIFNVCPGAHKWLSLDCDPRPGAATIVRIDAGNPYQFPINAFVVAAIPKFGSGGTDVSAAGNVLLQPGERKSVNLELNLPAGLFGGVYQVMACAIMGTTVNLFRKPIHVRAS